MFTLRIYYVEDNKIYPKDVQCNLNKLDTLRLIMRENNSDSVINAYGLKLSPKNIICYHLLLEIDSPFLVFSVKLKFKESGYITIPMKGNSNSRFFYNDVSKLVGIEPTKKTIEFQPIPKHFCLIKHEYKLLGVRYDFAGTNLGDAGAVNIFDQFSLEEELNGEVNI